MSGRTVAFTVLGLALLGLILIILAPNKPDTSSSLGTGEAAAAAASAPPAPIILLGAELGKSLNIPPCRRRHGRLVRSTDSDARYFYSDSACVVAYPPSADKRIIDYDFHGQTPSYIEGTPTITLLDGKVARI